MPRGPDKKPRKNVLDGVVFENRKFTYWTVIEFSDKTKYHTFYRCVCRCGTESRVNARALLSGLSKSCGCWHRENLTKRNTTHNLTNHPLTGIWGNIKTRCLNTKVYAYKNYGGRGITIEEPWKSDFKSFYDWALANGWEKGLEIDRINVNGNYCPKNCRIVTTKQQAQNRRDTLYIVIDGEKMPLIEAHSKYRIKIPYCLVCHRISKGWDRNAALFTPKLERNNRYFRVDSPTQKLSSE